MIRAAVRFFWGEGAPEILLQHAARWLVIVVCVHAVTSRNHLWHKSWAESSNAIQEQGEKLKGITKGWWGLAERQSSLF